MLRYALKRLLTLIPVFLIASFLTFMLGNMSSGDTARILAEKEFNMPTLEQIEGVRVKMGLDRPALVQYGSWLSKAMRGDLGESFKSGKPVLDEIQQLFPKTFLLALWSLVFIILISVPLGVLSAVFPRSLVDKFSRGLSMFSVSMPQFWLALLLLYLLGARLGLISVLGGSSIKHPVLPAFVVGICTSGIYLRLVRTNMEEVLEKGYIRAARAKGVSETGVVVKHALKNAVLPVINKLGIGFGGLLAGSSVIESIFSWNGLGKYALESVKLKDFPVVQGYVLFMAFLIVFINLGVDLLCSVIDPRLRTE